MFRTISWGQFISTLVIILIIYYAVVIFVYYRRDLRNFLLKKKSDPTKEEAGTFSQASHLKSAVQSVIDEAAEKGWSKQELLTALGGRIERQPGAKFPAIQIAINHHIAREADTLCNIQLEEQELKTIW